VSLFVVCLVCAVGVLAGACVGLWFKLEAARDAFAGERRAFETERERFSYDRAAWERERAGFAEERVRLTALRTFAQSGLVPQEFARAEAPEGEEETARRARKEPETVEEVKRMIEAGASPGMYAGRGIISQRQSLMRDARLNELGRGGGAPPVQSPNPAEPQTPYGEEEVTEEDKEALLTS
jgi:hypothetical protein